MNLDEQGSQRIHRRFIAAESVASAGLVSASPLSM